MRPFIVLLCCLSPLAHAWPILGPEGVPTDKTVEASAYFAEVPWGSNPSLRSDAQALAKVARATAAWLRAHPDDAATNAGLTGELGVTMGDVLATLDHLAALAEADIRDGTTKLHDPVFMSTQFRLLAWKPDVEAAGARGVRVDERIRMTRYLVYEEAGSRTKTERFTHALYAAPGGTEEAASALQTRFTRPQIIAGAFETGGEAAGLAEPLVWLTEEGVYRALMQGTVDVQLEGGGHAMFNVHKNNGIPYDRDQRDSAKQGRYWFFQPVDGLLGYGLEGTDRVVLQPGATVAGDVYNLGLGKVFALQLKEGLRLVVLADTGGAFQPNLYQLDYLTGSYPSASAFQAATSHLPERARAFMLVKRHADRVDVP